jgi:hypothetical protein
MKRFAIWSVATALLLTAVVGLRADVKTTNKSTFKLEGLMGGMVNRMFGGSDGITSTVAVKGNRMSTTTESTGQIIDLTEEKIYTLDLKKKEYKVMTFAEMRKQMEEARANMAKQQQQMDPEDKAKAEEAAKQIEFDVDVKETGQHKSLAGRDTREVVLTIAMREKGKTIEESGGLVMTNTMWLAPRVTALDEMADFHMRYFKAVYGGTFAGMDLQQMNAVSALLRGMAPMMEKMAAEGKKMQGTPLSTTTVFESVKSAEQMKSATPASGGGIGGMLARRMNRGGSQQRTTALTTTHETLSIATAVAADDVALPAGFKEKK